MFDAPHCWCCGEKEHKNGYGCNNQKCKEYYKLKGAKNTEQLLQPDYAGCITQYCGYIGVRRNYSQRS